MVQRKLLLRVQSDHIKPENRSISFKPSLQLQDYSKSRGSETKKKMKRTRSTRLKDTVSQPGKPPPRLDHEVAMAKTPQKQIVAKVTAGSPNYMKGTSSSEARRESTLSLQVSSRNVRASSDTKILHRTNQTGTKLGSGSGISKQTRSLSRTSSLKIARALTKTLSFKKCSRVALCADVNHVQGGTCSSTLKDSNFPEYLMLNPGGTEAEGTSVLKVCPYTYCSLNGHLHAQYPPLKSFVSARRRALKSQRSMKMEASSPRKEKPPSLVGEETVDSGEAPVSLVIQENGADSFVEIYVGIEKEHGGGNGCIVTDFSGKPEKQNRCSCEANSQVSESLSDGPPHSEIESEENFGCYNDILSIETGPEEILGAEEGENDYPSLLPKAEATGTGTCREIDSEGLFEITDMEWEEAGLFSLKAEDKGAYSDHADIVSLSEGDSLQSNEATGSDREVSPIDDDDADNLLGKGNSNGNAQSGRSDLETNGMTEAPGDLEQSENANQYCPDSSNDATEEKPEEEQGQDTEASLPSISISFLWAEEPFAGSPVAREMIQTDKAAEVEHNGLELNNHLGTTPDNSLTSEDTVDAGDGETSESGKDIVNESLLEDTQEHDLCGQQRKQAQDKEEQDRQKVCGFGLSKNDSEEIGRTELEVRPESAAEETFPSPDSKNIQGVQTPKDAFTRARKSSDQDQPDVCKKWMIKCKRHIEDTKDSRAFNPREPNYLPIVPEPNAEKVDLKHQDIDERKNAEEWMIDYALQRAVNKLGPARKRKVALLVEAFETVLPVAKCQTHVRKPSTAFTHGRPLQACN